MTEPLRFEKMHGLGNDFVVIDQRTSPSKLTVELVTAIADRHRGVGFDQLAEIRHHAGADAELVFWNADGSLSAACGNATRCIADKIMREASADTLTLRTERGALACKRRPDGKVEVDMGTPILDWQSIPLSRPVDTANLPIYGAPSACSMGNPHCTFFVDDLEDVDLAARGREIEHHPLFPERTNVQFVQVLGPRRARVRVWERGVGITLASGSSSCAVLVNAVRRGSMERTGVLELDGGEIEITWREDEHVLMAGPTAGVFEGVFAPEWIEAHR